MATTIILACILMPVLLYYESKEIPKGILPVKTTISLLFVIAALIQPRPIPSYFAWILPGLIFCLGGGCFSGAAAEKDVLLGTGIIPCGSYLLRDLLFLHSTSHSIGLMGCATDLNCQSDDFLSTQAPPGRHDASGTGLHRRHHHYGLRCLFTPSGTRARSLGPHPRFFRRPQLLCIGPFRGQRPLCQERAHQPYPGSPSLFWRSIFTGFFYRLSLIEKGTTVPIRGWRVQLPNYQGQNGLAIITA